MNEAKVYSVTVGNLSLMPWRWKSNKEFAKILKEECEGFLGVHPMYPNGMLLLFRTENEAKRARNILQGKGINCGKNICEAYIPEEYAEVSDGQDT